MGYLRTIILSLALCTDCLAQPLTQSELGFGGNVTLAAGDLFLVVTYGSNITSTLIGSSSYGGYSFSFNSSPTQGYITNFNASTGVFTYQLLTSNSENFTYLVHSSQTHQSAQGNVFVTAVNTNFLSVGFTNCFPVTNYAGISQSTNTLTGNCTPARNCYPLTGGGQFCAQQALCSVGAAPSSTLITIGGGTVCAIVTNSTPTPPPYVSSLQHMGDPGGNTATMQPGSTDQNMTVAISAPNAFVSGPFSPYLEIKLGKSYAIEPTIVIQTQPTITPSTTLKAFFVLYPPYQTIWLSTVASVGNITSSGNLVITTNAH